MDLIALLKNPTVIVALVGLAGIIIGSLLTTIFAPWIKWNLEKKRKVLEEKLKDKERKRELIAKWRSMVHSASVMENYQEVLQRHNDFYSLEPHLSQNGRKRICGRVRTFRADAVLPDPIIAAKKEIDRIEREWELI